MVTAFYGIWMGLLLVWLAIQVIKQRRKHRIAYADGGDQALMIARSAHSNAAEYIPIILILMGLAEINQAPQLIIHICGGILILGRVCHAYGILKEKLKFRVRGMVLTFADIMALAMINAIYLPWDRII